MAEGGVSTHLASRELPRSQGRAMQNGHGPSQKKPLLSRPQRSISPARPPVCSCLRAAAILASLCAPVVFELCSFRRKRRAKKWRANLLHNLDASAFGQEVAPNCE